MVNFLGNRICLHRLYIIYSILLLLLRYPFSVIDSHKDLAEKVLKCRIFQLAKVNHGYVKHIYLISGRHKNDSSSSNSNYNSFGSYECRFEVYLYLMYL